MSAKVTVVGAALSFGLCDESTFAKLPDGFRYYMTPKSFVKAIGPDGREWFYVGGETPHLERSWKATQEDVDRTSGNPFGGLKLGQEFIDAREQIAL